MNPQHPTESREAPDQVRFSGPLPRAPAGDPIRTLDDYYSGQLIPACGGTEQPFVVNGRTWLYCYHPRSGRHVYLDVDRDVTIWNRNFHPVDAPLYELEPDDLAPNLPTTATVEKTRAVLTGAPYAW